MPNEVHQVDSPQGFPLICAGDPNGAIRAPQGTLAIDNITPAVWQNANGVTTWTNISGGGGGGITSWGLQTEAAFSGSGDPNGVVTAAEAGDVYADETGTLWVATAGDDSSWVNVGAGTGITEWGRASTAQFVNAGDPNTVVTALEAGDICLDTSTPAVWIATNAGTVWIKIGPLAGTGFPITANDGTHTYTISRDSSGNITLKTTLNAGTVLQAEVDLGTTEGLNVNIPATNLSGISIINHGGAGDAGIDIDEANAASTGGINFSDAGSGGFNVTANTGGVNFASSGAGVSFSGKTGFFGVTPVAQQATPVTLGDVIALLQAYGLSA